MPAIPYMRHMIVPAALLGLVVVASCVAAEPTGPASVDVPESLEDDWAKAQRDPGPEKRLKPTAVAKIDAGGARTCALTVQDEVYCWGDYAGNLPVLVVPAAPAGRTYVDLATGNFHTCVLDDVGRAFCTGQNSYGQLGDGTLNPSSEPVAVAMNGLPRSTSFTAIAAGVAHTCALTEGGTAYCWGQESHGSLGNGSTAIGGGSSPLPGPVAGGQQFVQMSIMRNSACGVTTSGGAYCWGIGAAGLLSGFSPSPTPVLGGLSFTMVSVGGQGPLRFCGVLTGSQAVCWDAGPPELVPNAPAFSSVWAGGVHACGLTQAGQAYCWGHNSTGAVGNGSGGPGAHVANPVHVEGWHSFKALSLGLGYSCGVSIQGETRCWGSNVWGQLGNGNYSDSYVPGPVSW